MTGTASDAPQSASPGGRVSQSIGAPPTLVTLVTQSPELAWRAANQEATPTLTISRSACFTPRYRQCAVIVDNCSASATNRALATISKELPASGDPGAGSSFMRT